MRRFLCALLFTGFVGLAISGCSAFSGGDDESGIVTLSGQVLNNQTNNPVPGAFVRVLPFDLLFEADEQGQFSFDVEIDSTMELRLSATKEGFSTSSTNLIALAGRTITVPTFRINQVVQDELDSGRASNILLLGQSAESIGVRESGSEEVAQITFQVADSLGRPVVLKNAATVDFKFGVRPGGDEFLYPSSAKTDNNGQVTVNLSSGTRAGVVQIVAEANVGGRLIRSLPVSVAVHGGLPDQSHFTVGPARRNFAGHRFFGLKNAVSVVVGDKYGNPVKEGTSVYFTTNYGVVEGSLLTDGEGQGSVNLISGNPLPPDGVAIVTASTADEGQATVLGQTPVVFSGVPVVTVEPTIARLNQTYRMTVTDQFGNPLVEGTNISVRVEGVKVKATGHTSVSLDDTAFLGGMTYDHILRGPGITEFTFSANINDSVDTEGIPEVSLITILVNGPNGRLEIVLGGEGSVPTTRMDGVVLDTLPGGSVRATLEDLSGF